jgi:hypothetical protein
VCVGTLRFLRVYVFHTFSFSFQDIKDGNVLMNHFGAGNYDYQMLRQASRREGRLVYAMFDFDVSFIFPSSSTLEQRRLPYHLSWWGTFSPLHDTAQGELDYDPFAFDVGVLGVLFCHNFQVGPLDPFRCPLLCSEFRNST